MRSIMRVLLVIWIALIVFNTQATQDRIAISRGGAVYLIDANGKELKTLASGLVYDRPLVWSPQGKYLIYWKHSNTGWDLWRVDAEGKNARNLTNVKSGGCRSATWSPNGKQIAFMRDNPLGVWLMNADGSGMRQLTNQADRDAAPVWSPDGKTLAFQFYRSNEDSETSQIGLYSFTSKRQQTPMPAKRSCFSPAWSFDSETLFYLSCSGGNCDLYSMNVSTQKEKRLTNTTAAEKVFALSPDKKQIAVITEQDDKWRVQLLSC